MENKTINIIVGIGIVVAVLFGVTYQKAPVVNVSLPATETTLGSAAGTEHYFQENFFNGVRNGITKKGVTITLTATSSVPAAWVYPFLNNSGQYSPGERAIIDSVICRGIGLTGSNLVAISTTSLTNIYHGVNASSTRALTPLMTIGSGEAFNLVWTPQSVATTTDPDTRILYNRMDYTHTTTTPFILFPNEALTLKYASSSPGTFASYATGKCSAVFSKLEL